MACEEQRNRITKLRQEIEKATSEDVILNTAEIKETFEIYSTTTNREGNGHSG